MGASRNGSQGLKLKIKYIFPPAGSKIGDA